MGAWVFRRDRRRLSRQLESVYAMFPILKDKRRDSAGSLSGGQGRMLSVARELMTQPSLLLIDEPTVGLAPNLVAQVYSLLAAAKIGNRSGDPAGGAERGGGAAAGRLSLPPQSRPGEGRGAGARIRQLARARTGAGMSAGLTGGVGAFVDWRRVAAVLAHGSAAAPCAAAVRGRVRGARAGHQRLLRHPRRELEHAGRVHRPVLARPAWLCRARRLHVGAARLSSAAPRFG